MDSKGHTLCQGHGHESSAGVSDAYPKGIVVLKMAVFRLLLHFMNSPNFSGNGVVFLEYFN